MFSNVSFQSIAFYRRNTGNNILAYTINHSIFIDVPVVFCVQFRKELIDRSIGNRLVRLIGFPQTGEFRCPEEGGGLYAFWVTCCTFDMKKALLAIRKNGKDVANVFDQDGDQNKASFEGKRV